MLQQTLVLIKPDGVERGLVGEIVKRFEQRGLKIVGMKMVNVERSLAESHYPESIATKHGKHVRDYLLDYVTMGPVVAIVIQGLNAVSNVRKIVGSTYPDEAEIGTIRGDFSHTPKQYAKTENRLHNLIHASENEEDAKKELVLWFSEDEIHEYELSHEKHIY